MYEKCEKINKYEACDNRKKRELFAVRKKPKRIYNKKIFKKLVSNRNETKTKMLINKTVYLGLAKFDISKIVMHECLYDYM